MPEVQCPHCHKIFKLNDTDYTDIVQQIRDQKFDEEIQQRLNIELKLSEAQLTAKFHEQLNTKEQEFYNLQAANKQIITDLENKLKNNNNQKELELIKVTNPLKNRRLEKLLHVVY